MYSDNNGGIPVKVTYCTPSGVIGKKVFNSNNTFSSLLDYFDNNLKKEGQTRLKDSYILNGENISPNELLGNLIGVDDINQLSEAEFTLEVDENEKLEDENDPSMEKILQPKTRPFGLYIYKPKDAVISLEHYPPKIASKFDLEKYGDSSANCNSPTHLYASGGQGNKSFWIIDKNNHSIIKKILPMNKSNHSMIYLKKPTECVFFVGGDDLKSFYYDIKKNCFINWGDSHERNKKPALAQSGDFLYCLGTLTKRNNYFERTNLKANNRRWEKVYPAIENGKENAIFNQSFGACQGSNGKILLLGGQNPEQVNTFSYDPLKNSLTECPNSKNEPIDLNDKSFYKVDKVHNIALPSTLGQNKEVAIANKLKRSVRKINFCSGGGRISKIRAKEYLDQSFNGPAGEGTLTVKRKMKPGMNKIPSGRIYNRQETGKNQDQPPIGEQSIINVSSPEIDENKLPVEKIKIDRPIDMLYLPNSVIDNQFVDRQVHNDNEEPVNQEEEQQQEEFGEEEQLQPDYYQEEQEQPQNIEITNNQEDFIHVESPDLDENKIPIPKIQIDKPFDNIYISQKSMDDQLINREVTEGDEQNNDQPNEGQNEEEEHFEEPIGDQFDQQNEEQQFEEQQFEEQIEEENFEDQNEEQQFEEQNEEENFDEQQFEEPNEEENYEEQNENEGKGDLVDQQTEELILDLDSPEVDLEKLELEKIKIEKPVDMLYLSSSAIDNQLVNRKVYNDNEGPVGQEEFVDNEENFEEQNEDNGENNFGDNGNYNYEEQYIEQEEPIKQKDQYEIQPVQELKIIDFNSPEVDENKLPIGKIKIEKPCEILYLPSSAVDDQLVKREVYNENEGPIEQEQFVDKGDNINYNNYEEQEHEHPEEEMIDNQNGYQIEEQFVDNGENYEENFEENEEQQFNDEQNINNGNDFNEMQENNNYEEDFDENQNMEQNEEAFDENQNMNMEQNQYEEGGYEENMEQNMDQMQIEEGGLEENMEQNENYNEDLNEYNLEQEHFEENVRETEEQGQVEYEEGEGEGEEAVQDGYMEGGEEGQIEGMEGEEEQQNWGEEEQMGQEEQFQEDQNVIVQNEPEEKNAYQKKRIMDAFKQGGGYLIEQKQEYIGNEQEDGNVIENQDGAYDSGENNEGMIQQEVNYEENDGEQQQYMGEEEGNFVEGEEGEAYEGEEGYEEGEGDSQQVRDLFKQTITQQIGEDIIQVEDFPKGEYDMNNFCDYKIK